MPKILAPVEPRGPATVISLPRPRYVGAAPTGLPALGQAVSQSGNFLLQHLVAQERAAARTKLETEAATRLGELEAAIDAAGTVAEGRAILQAQMPEIVGGLTRSAADAGLPEFADELALLAKRSEMSSSAALAKRVSREGVDDFQLLLQAYQDQMAGARTTADYIGLRGELQRAAVHVAQNNPLVSPAQAEALYRAALQKGAVRRATGMIEGAVGNTAALRAAQSAVLDPDQFPDLPADARADLVRLSAQLEDHATDRAWQQHRRAEMMSAEALEKTQSATARTVMRRLSAGENVTDQELLYMGAEGTLAPPMINALQSWRDGTVQSDPDFSAYLEDSIMSELGALDPEVAAERVRTGAYSPEKAFSLLDQSATSWRRGGLHSLDRVKDAKRSILNFVLGAVGDDYNSLVRALDEAGDTEKRLAENLLTRFHNQVDAAQSQVEGGTLDPRDFDPFPIAADILEAGFDQQARPLIAPVPGPIAVERYSSLDIKGLEQALEDMRAMAASGNFSRLEGQQLNDQIYAVQNQIDRLRQFEANRETIRLLRKERP